MARLGGGGKGNETLQIIILIPCMMAGCFALIAGVLWFWLVPAKAAELEAQRQDHQKLMDQLDKKNDAKTGMWTIRRRYREAEKTKGSSRDLRAMVEAERGSLQWSQFPQTTRRKIGNTEEQTQTIDLKEAPLQEVFNFVARVKQVIPSVQVGGIKLTRSGRPGGGPASAAASAPPGEDDRWTANLQFHLYATGPGSPSTSSSAAPAPKEEPEEN